jgi:hypothetical protein
MSNLNAETKPSDAHETNLEILKLDLERDRYRAEIIKWIVLAIGAAVSFAVIDYGKLRLERARLASDNQFKFIEAYTKAMESAEPEIWKRRLDVLHLFATDDKVRGWATNQLNYIDRFAALDALYRETVKTASQLVDRSTVNDPERMKARRRFEQLYWADLPFAGESSEVESGMVAFRDGLVAAEQAPKDVAAWNNLNSLLIKLSKIFKGATRQSSGPAQVKANP